MRKGPARLVICLVALATTIVVGTAMAVTGSDDQADPIRSIVEVPRTALLGQGIAPSGSKYEIHRVNSDFDGVCYHLDIGGELKGSSCVQRPGSSGDVAGKVGQAAFDSGDMFVMAVADGSVDQMRAERRDGHLDAASTGAASLSEGGQFVYAVIAAPASTWRAGGAGIAVPPIVDVTFLGSDDAVLAEETVAAKPPATSRVEPPADGGTHGSQPPTGNQRTFRDLSDAIQKPGAVKTEGDRATLAN